MATPAEVLVQKSPLTSGTPAEHLLAIIIGGGGGSGTEPLLGVLQAPPPLAGAVVAPVALIGALSAPQALSGSLVTPAVLAGSIIVPTLLVGRIECNGEIVTDLSFPYGRSFSTALNFFESDGTTPKDCTGGVVEWWVNDAPADGITDSVEIVKRSYDSAEIETVDAAQGQFTLKVRSSDNELDPGEYFHCAILTLRGAVATAAGTVSVTAGSGTITGSGLATADINDNDLLVMGAGANSGQTVVVRLERDGNGAPTGNLVTAFTEWVDEAGVSITVYEADRPDVSGVFGKYTIQAC